MDNSRFLLTRRQHSLNLKHQKCTLFAAEMNSRLGRREGPAQAQSSPRADAAPPRPHRPGSPAYSLLPCPGLNGFSHLRRVSPTSRSRPHARSSTRTLTSHNGHHSDCPVHKRRERGRERPNTPCGLLTQPCRVWERGKPVCGPAALTALPEPSRPRGRPGPSGKRSASGSRRSRHGGPHL